MDKFEAFVKFTNFTQKACQLLLQLYLGDFGNIMGLWIVAKLTLCIIGAAGKLRLYIIAGDEGIVGKTRQDLVSVLTQLRIPLTDVCLLHALMVFG